MTGTIVSLTTDFGAGAYVAQVKAAILQSAPDARLIDVTHELAAHAVVAGEIALRAVAFTFPPGSVHLVVVDPGVGTARRAIAVAARERFFVGPDNGVLGMAVAAPGAMTVELDRPELFRQPVAPTFHGRDIFAPVAAALASGRELQTVGKKVHDPKPSLVPVAQWDTNRVSGETVAADRFGNLLSNLPVDELRRRWQRWQVSVAGEAVPWHNTYGEVASGTLLALAGSDGFVEIAVREGSAAEHLKRAAGLTLVCANLADE